MLPYQAFASAPRSFLGASDVADWEQPVLPLVPRSLKRTTSLEALQGAKKRHVIKEGDSFLPQDTPPLLQQDGYFQISATTLVAVVDQPYRLGNDLLSFLQTQAAAPVKVRRGKFTIKATLIYDVAHVVVKFRLVTLPSGAVAVQVQRRAGDAFAFADILQQVSQYLQELGYELQPFLDFGSIALPQPPFVGDSFHEPAMVAALVEASV